MIMILCSIRNTHWPAACACQWLIYSDVAALARGMDEVVHTAAAT